MKFKVFILLNLVLFFLCLIIPCVPLQSIAQEESGPDIGEERRKLIEETLKKRKEKLQTQTPGQTEGGFPGGALPSSEIPKEEARPPVTEEAVETPPQEEEQTAEDEEAEEEAVPEEEVKEKPPAAKGPAVTPGTVSFFFDDADIFEVVQTVFGDILKVNYLIDPQVTGRVNFRTVTPIPKEEVLSVMEVIFRLNGIGFVEEKGLYRIIPLELVSKELVYSQIGKSPEKVAIEMFTFKNLDLKESMPDIENALGLHIQGGTVRIMPIFRLNSLIVVASSMENLAYIRKWVEVFDELFAVARPKIFVYPLQNSKATHIASLLQSIFTGTAPTTKSTTSSAQTTATQSQPSTPTTPTAKTGAAATATGGGSFVSAETRVFADEITNSLIILATPADYSFIEETIEKLDTLPRQVIIEALIAEITLSDDLSLGFAWSLKTDINISGLKPFNRDIDLEGQMGQRPSALITEEDSATLSGSGFTFLATDPSGIVRARLEALAQDSRAKVLASPHILVLDNREARIQIGDQVPIATSETNITGTTQIQRTIQYKDTGVILTVKPQINEGGLVSLELTQEVSTFSIQKIFDSDQVVISKREATTNLVAQDGQTIVIGGLIQEQSSDAREGIPFLSKIPLLGYLFGSTTETYERRELIILLTPHVIKNQQAAGAITSDYMKRLKGVQEEIEKEELIMDDLLKKQDIKDSEK